METLNTTLKFELLELIRDLRAAVRTVREEFPRQNSVCSHRWTDVEKNYMADCFTQRCLDCNLVRKVS